VNLQIKDRLALVTGASRGIGRAIAVELAREGARVILVARTQDQLEAARNKLSRVRDHYCIALDLLLPESVAELAERINALGEIDIMVHNLGGSAGGFSALAPSEDWKSVWQFNLGIGHELNRVFMPGMVSRRWGRIVFISSLATMTYRPAGGGNPPYGNIPYITAKCALEGYVRSMSRDVSKHNVIITAVSPGAIYIEGRYFAKLEIENPKALEDYFQDHLPIGRLGQAHEVATVVAFLCSDQASFMPGSIVEVNGGGV
jgi:3-oxoacyl-[acyl-carrier protein] reductase